MNTASAQRNSAKPGLAASYVGYLEVPLETSLSAEHTTLTVNTRQRISLEETYDNHRLCNERNIKVSHDN